MGKFFPFLVAMAEKALDEWWEYGATVLAMVMLNLVAFLSAMVEASQP